MAQWPPFTVTTVLDTDPVSWPARVEVGPLDIVGPTKENQQPTALAARTETLRATLNLLGAMFNEVREHFLDRDGDDPAVTLEGGEVSDQGPVWMRGDMDMGGFKIVNLGDATDPTDLVAFNQLQQIQFDAEDDVEQVLDNFVYKTDGSAVGAAPLNAGVQRVIQVGSPIATTDAERKDEFDASIAALQASLVLLNGGSTMSSDLSLDGPVPTDPGFFVVNLGDPTADGHLVNKRYLDEQVALVGAEDVPVGTVLPFAGTAVPTNFLICDGREVSRFVYQALFNVIGIAYGAPSSSNVFKLPDLRGRVVVGKDNMGGQSANRITAGWADSIGGVGGAEGHVLTLGQMAAHTHTYDDHLYAEGLAGAEDGADDGTDADNLYQEEVRNTTSQGSNIAHNNLQPSMTQLWIIRT